MKKKILLMICSVLVSASLVGCGAESEAVDNEETATVVEEGAASTVISPLPVTIDMNNLDNCTVPVALEQGAAYVDDAGVMQMDVTVYTYDLYDMVDMSALKEGDTIVIRGEEVVVSSLEQNDYGTLFVNGGLENGGFEFFHDDSGVWFECGYNDAKNYYELGKKTISVSADFEFSDSSDLDKGEITYSAEDLMSSDMVYHFVPGNTSIVIEEGVIIKMYRTYMP